MYNPVLLFLDIGGPEMMLILVVALLVFGGDKLPELARGLGKGIRDFKDAANGVKDEFHETINKLEEKKPLATGLAQDQNQLGEYAGGATSTGVFGDTNSSEFAGTNQSYSNPNGYHTTQYTETSENLTDHSNNLGGTRYNPYPGHTDHPDHTTDYKGLDSYTIVPPETTTGNDQNSITATTAKSVSPAPSISPAAGTLQYDSHAGETIEPTESNSSIDLSKPVQKV